MEFQIPIQLTPLPQLISYPGDILLSGSCFTEHIGDRLQEAKFNVLQNPHGILFDPHSVADSLLSYAEHRRYELHHLFLYNEVWQSWQHHGRFSDPDKEKSLAKINASQQQAHDFLKSASWIIVTLGSSFSYRLSNDGARASNPGEKNTFSAGMRVANCHRAPAQWFSRELMEIDSIVSTWRACYEQLRAFNPRLKFLFTISPVRHIRDGVTDNNRSKARLIEAVHRLAEQLDEVYYFPAYELVIDVLRDYRFYDIDLVHPNYMATEFVMEKFAATCISKPAQELMQEIRKIVVARKHRPFQPSSRAHREFLELHAEKTASLQARFPFLDLREELKYFQEIH